MGPRARTLHHAYHRAHHSGVASVRNTHAHHNRQHEKTHRKACTRLTPPRRCWASRGADTAGAATATATARQLGGDGDGAAATARRERRRRRATATAARRPAAGRGPARAATVVTATARRLGGDGGDGSGVLGDGQDRYGVEPVHASSGGEGERHTDISRRAEGRVRSRAAYLVRAATPTGWGRLRARFGTSRSTRRPGRGLAPRARENCAVQQSVAPDAGTHREQQSNVATYGARPAHTSAMRCQSLKGRVCIASRLLCARCSSPCGQRKWVTATPIPHAGCAGCNSDAADMLGVDQAAGPMHSDRER